MTRRLFIIRHGQTEWNLAHRLQGGADSPLTAKGLAQLPQLAAYLDQYAFAAAYTSPLGRARATAEQTLAQFTRHAAPPLRVDERLRELAYGDWEGQTKATLMAREPDLFAQLSAREFSPALAARHIEDFELGRERFAAACRAIAAGLADHENALVFSHGGISQLGIQTLTANPHLLGLKNLSTSIVAVTAAGFGVDSYNQTAYLTHVDLDEGNVSIA